MAYEEPGLRLFQEFADVVAGGANVLHATILGPQFALHRYNIEAEKARIDTYDRSANKVYSWPQHIPGGDIDLDTAQIMVENGMLKYFTSGSPANLVADNSNQLRFAEILASNSAAARNAALGTRNVKAGDVARLNWTDGSGAHQMDTVINALIADITPGTDDPDLTRTQGTGDTTGGATQNSAPPTRLTISYDAAAYNGLPVGYPSDDYTIRVTAAVLGSGLGNLTGTTFKITSAGGDTEQTIVLSDANWSIANSQYEVSLGSRGAILEVVDAGAGVINLEDSWSVTVAQTYAEIDVTDDAQVSIIGPYTGLKNTQYIITCTKGGTLGTDDLKFKFRTNNGADTTGYINSFAADFTVAQQDYAFGNANMQLSLFETTQWNAGDVFIFDVATSAAGPIYTASFRDAIPALAVTNITVSLLVVQTFALDDINYSLTQDNINVFANAVQDSDLLGTVQSLEVYGGSLYADYRELNTAAANTLIPVDSVSSVEALLGPVSPLNPLAQGAHEALSRSNGMTVYVVGVQSDDMSGYVRVLDILTSNNQIYGIVALTNDVDIHNLCVSHVDERSNPNNNQWRTTWIPNNTAKTISVYTELSGGDDVVATVEDYAPNGAKKVVAVGALFVTNGVAPGNILRINFDDSDPVNPTWDEYTVDSVTEDDIILLTALPSPIGVPVKIEIWKNLTNSEYAAAIGAHSASFDNRRVMCVWADNYVDQEGESKELYYLCCSLAGLRSGAAPHAPLTEVSIPSVYLDPVIKFGKSDLNAMASGGTWIVVKDEDGRVYTRHQLTTEDNYVDIARRESSVTSNLDHISRDFYTNTRDLIGQSNISPDLISLINSRIKNIALSISSRSYSPKLGPQLLDLEIVKIARDAVLRDTVVVKLNPTLPVPLNHMDITLSVIT